MVKKRSVIIALVLVILVVALCFLLYSKNCGWDESCFQGKAMKCSKASVSSYSDGNHYRYEIMGKRKGDCIVRVSFVEPEPTMEPKLKEALSGKKMTCEISSESLSGSPVSKIEDFSSHCSGPLREVLLEITLDQLYEVVTEKIGTISLEYKNVLQGIGNSS